MQRPHQQGPVPWQFPEQWIHAKAPVKSEEPVERARSLIDRVLPTGDSPTKGPCDMQGPW